MELETKRAAWVSLSHPLGRATPAYGGGEGFQSEPLKDMSSGDSCNSSVWTLSNHLGTHLDFPRHFVADGKTCTDYPLDFFLFKHIAYIDLGEIQEGTIITWQDLKTDHISKNTELLLLKTGFGAKRSTPSYWQANPGFSPELADVLRVSCPKLRVLGFDSISLSSYKHRELGRTAHKNFLEHNQPILPLEDMNLSALKTTTQIKQLIVAPWIVMGADATPCTVMAELTDEA